MTCPKVDWVDAHFAGRLATAEEAQLRGHLPGCAECRARYQRQLLAERLDPRAAGPRARLGRSLGLPAARRWSLWVGVPAVAAAAAALLLLINMGPAFQSRGGAGPAALEIYRLEGQRPQKVTGAVRGSDELAFAYRNPARKHRLLVFAVDEHAHVFWYHPAWVKSTEEPTAIVISSDAALHELPEAIAQPLDGRELRVTAWFVDEPLSVKRVEALLAQGRVAEGAVAVERVLRVDR